MKPKDFQKKLALKKTTVVSLENDRLRAVRGGGDTKPPTRCDCYSADTLCPTRPGMACTT